MLAAHLHRFVFDNFHRTTQAFLRAAGQQQRADRIDRYALAANDFAHVLRIQAQFIDNHAPALHRRDAHRVGILHEAFDDIFQERLHRTKNENQAAGTTALAAFLMMLATVSLGWAPLLTQYWARSSLSVKLSPFFNGSYVPISSMNLPSRGLRPSATTMRNTGAFLAPTRFMRIFTAINLSKERED